MGWDEVVVKAARPSFSDALAASRMRFLARLPNAPTVLLALIQTAGNQWCSMVLSDLEVLQATLAPNIGSFALTSVPFR